MVSALRAELVRLFRFRLFGPCMLAAAAIAILGTLLTRFGAALPGGSDPEAVRLLSTPRGIVDGLFGPFTVILAGLSSGLAASLLSSDFSYRTFRTQAIAHPGRPSLLSGKLAAIAVYLLAGAVVAVIAASLTALITASQSAHADGWYSMHALADAIVTVGALWLALASYASVGVAAALLIRSPGPATLIGVIYVTGIDGYLTSALQHISHGIRSWLPQPSIISVVEGAPGHPAQALSVAIVFAAILLTMAFTSFIKRDIA
jgi:hypothetical protein